MTSKLIFHLKYEGPNKKQIYHKVPKLVAHMIAEAICDHWDTDVEVIVTYRNKTHIKLYTPESHNP